MDKITIFRIILGAVLVALFLSFIGCKTLPVIIPQTQRDSVRVLTELRVDTFWRDRWHTEKQRGDTVFVHDSICFEKIKFRDRIDSVIIRDSIPYPVEVTKEVRVRNAYDRFTARGFWVFVGALVLYIVWRLLKAKISAI